MPDSDRRFHPARLVARADAGGGLTRVIIEPPPDVTGTYVSPGQYVEVRAEGQTGFFVLSNDPGSATWELHMRSGGGASDVLLAAEAPRAVDISEAIGRGFPTDEARGAPLLVALGGTGVAAGPPIVRRRVRDGDARRTHVYVGARNKDELPASAMLLDWMDSGVFLLVCLSQDGIPPHPIPYARGYVQDVLRSRAAHLAAERPRVFVVGAASLIAALQGLAREWGIPVEHVHTNY